MNIVLSCHVSKEIGMGHFTRQLNIAAELAHHGNNVTFAISDYKPALNLLDKKQILYLKSKSFPFEFTDKLKADIVILDINDTNRKYIRKIKKNCNKIISFDDQGTGRNIVDLLVDANLDKRRFSKKKGLFGPEYVILHNKFSVLRNRKKRISDKIKRVVISMGGTDPKNIGPIITNFLLKSRINYKINLTLGAGFNDKDNEVKNIDQIEKRDNNSKFRLYKNLPHIAEILFSADLAICSGGITLYEACAVGTPALVINQAKHQQKTASLVEKWGAAINLGMWKKSIPAKLVQTINSLDAKKRKGMSIVGKKMIDGKGLQRIIKEIEKL